MDRLPTLTTTRLRLRHLDPGDVPALYAIFSDLRVMRFWSSGPLADVAAAAALRDDVERLAREDALYQWGIERRDAPGVVGTATLFRIDRTHRRAEIGFALHPEQWGRGYAGEAVGALVAHAFDERGLHRLEADVDPRNEASLRVCERLGFVREGLLRERYHVNGEIQDSVILGLLAPAWQSRRSLVTSHLRLRG